MYPALEFKRGLRFNKKRNVGKNRNTKPSPDLKTRITLVLEK